MRKILVTGIGTEIGKTVVSTILLRALHGEYWKPVQAGELEFTDTDKVRQWTRDLYIYHEEIFKLKSPMSPHIAAEIDGIAIKSTDFKFPTHEKQLIIEGAGGIMVPINFDKDYLVPSLAPNIDCIVLVSANYLGSINHTLLSINELRKLEKPIFIIFNGKEVPSTEMAIQSHLNENERIIGHVPEAEEVVNADFIDAVAQQMDVSMFEEKKL